MKLTQECGQRWYRRRSWRRPLWRRLADVGVSFGPIMFFWKHDKPTDEKEMGWYEILCIALGLSLIGFVLIAFGLSSIH